MTKTEKFLVLWLVAMAIVALVVTHVAGHLAFVIEKCFALVLPMLRS